MTDKKKRGNAPAELITSRVDALPPLTATQRAKLAASLGLAVAPTRAIDDPVKLARAARIMRLALERKRKS